MTHTRRHTATVLATVGLALGLGLGGLSACSQADPAPMFAEKPSASPTPEAKETAEEFIRRWNEATNSMMSGDSKEYRELSSNCPQCLRTAERLDSYYGYGGGVDGTDRKVISVERSPRFPGEPHMFSVKFRSFPSVVSESSAGPEQTFPGGDFLNDVLLSEDGNGWRVLSYAQVAERDAPPPP